MSTPASIAEIREAAVADIPKLATVQLRSALTAFDHIFPSSIAKPTQAGLESEWDRLVTASEIRVLVATVGSEHAGVVVFGEGETLGTNTDCVLRKLYVVPEHTRKGIADALHDRAISALVAGGHLRAGLWVLERNLVARRMYERRGWQLRPWFRSDFPGSGILELGYSLELPTRL